MNVKPIKEIIDVDRISEDKTWDKIYDKVSKIEGDVCIDFTGVYVHEPWKCNSFCELLSLPNVTLKFTNEETTVNNIILTCIFRGINNSDKKVINIKEEQPQKKDKAELDKEAKGREFMKFFTVDGDTAIVEMKNVYDGNFQDTNTCTKIEYAIKFLNEEQGVTKVKIDLTGVRTTEENLKYLAIDKVIFGEKGIDIDIITTNQEYSNIIKLKLHKLKNDEYTIEKRKARFIELFSKYPNAPGILIKYKNSKTVDENGRYGKGEVVMARIAIFRGFANGKLRFETFDNNYFVTQADYMANHDNEQLDSLVNQFYEMTLSEIGLCNEFIGSKFHFNQAIQHDPSQSVTVITGVNENGNSESKLYTLPERMRCVFDDWGVLYNEEYLNIASKLTDEYLASVE